MLSIKFWSLVRTCFTPHPRLTLLLDTGRAPGSHAFYTAVIVEAVTLAARVIVVVLTLGMKTVDAAYDDSLSEFDFGPEAETAE